MSLGKWFMILLRSTHYQSNKDFRWHSSELSTNYNNFIKTPISFLSSSYIWWKHYSNFLLLSRVHTHSYLLSTMRWFTHLCWPLRYASSFLNQATAWHGLSNPSGSLDQPNSASVTSYNFRLIQLLWHNSFFFSLDTVKHGLSNP